MDVLESSSPRTYLKQLFRIDGRFRLRRQYTPYVIKLRCLFKDLFPSVIHAFQFVRFPLRPDELGRLSAQVASKPVCRLVRLFHW